MWAPCPWVSDLDVCIFIVYLCIHALLVSSHLNWLMRHYFLCGWLIVSWQFLGYSSCKVFCFSWELCLERLQITSFFPWHLFQIMFIGRIQKPQMFCKKKYRQRSYIFYLRHRIFSPVRLRKNRYDCSHLLSSWGLGIRRRAIFAQCIRGTLTLESQCSHRLK